MTRNALMMAYGMLLALILAIYCVGEFLFGAVYGRREACMWLAAILVLVALPVAMVLMME